jgi:hypothetical protein
MHVNAVLVHPGDALRSDGRAWGSHCNRKRER